MKADLSRETFHPRHRYAAVRLQQGRVVTDADFNEQGDLTRHRAERLTMDTIGASGGPAEGAGFGLSAATTALAVHAASASSVWVVGEDGVLLVSTDGGANWSLRPTTSTRHLRAVARAGNTGWAVGDGGTLLRSSNAGTDWVAQTSGTVQTLRGVAVFDSQRAWAVGDGGRVLRTTDGGTTWTAHASGVDRLNDVVFASTQNGLAVGHGGAILRSTDGGASWARVNSGTTAHLGAVALAGARAWAVGDDGTVLRSADGGATWTASASGSSATLRAVRFRDGGDIGWAAGDGGTLLRSDNGGASWTAQAVAGGPGLAGLSLAGTEAPWLVGGGQVWRVADTGAGAPAGLPPASLRIGAGRYWVDGQLCEWFEPASLANQPDGGVPQRLGAGTHLVYLRTWQRHVSALEDPRIREVALGGPDTATRAQQVAQVRALALPALPANQAWHCGAPSGDWDALTAPPSARLAARAEPQLAASGVCDIAASAGYRRLENQLYRVEIHSVDNTGAARFKWSRENGSVAYAVESVSVDTATGRTTVRLAMRGRDANLDLALHDRVELIDDDAERQGRAGAMFEYLNDGDDALELVLDGLPPGTLGQDPSRHPVLRRWEQRPAAAGEHTLAVQEGVWITLEDGVQVRFSPGGRYRPGDHWQVPARTASADVEWPLTAEGEPEALPPAGVRDGWARLGLVTVDANGLIAAITDCRDLFPPLTRMTQLAYVGGDGQSAAPGGALAEPLRLRVARGALPVPGARVRFAVEAGGGNLALVAPWGTQTGTSVDAVCDTQGLAQCNWRLGTPAGQRVRAQLLTSGGAVIAEQQLVFAAQAATPAQGTRGCELTIGEGGDFPALDTTLLSRLMEERGQLCLCFLPGNHSIEGGLLLDLSNSSLPRRLSIHGCGPTAVVSSARPISLIGLAALELRDLNLQLSERAIVALQNIPHIDIEGLTIAGRTDSALPWLSVQTARVLRMRGCTVAAAPRASALFQGIAGTCDISHCVFGGDVAFYGMPPATFPLARLRTALANGDFEVPAGQGMLTFAHNQLPKLALGDETLKLLTERRFEGLFHGVALSGNQFSESPVLCAGVLLTCAGNHFAIERAADGTTYGVMVSRSAAASANVGDHFGDNATVHFLTTKGQFKGAANMVFTLPQSTP